RVLMQFDVVNASVPAFALTVQALFVELQLPESDSGATSHSKLAGLFPSRQPKLRALYRAIGDSYQRLPQTEQLAPCLSCQSKTGATRARRLEPTMWAPVKVGIEADHQGGVRPSDPAPL